MAFSSQFAATRENGNPLRLHHTVSDYQIVVPLDCLTYERWNVRRVMLTIRIHRHYEIGTHIQSRRKSCPSCRTDANVRHMLDDQGSRASRGPRSIVTRPIIDYERDDLQVVDNSRNPTYHFANRGTFV